MEVKNIMQGLKEKIRSVKSKVKGSIIEENAFSQKFDLNFRTLKILGVVGMVIFIAVVFSLPTDIPIEFTEKSDRPQEDRSQDASGTQPNQKSISDLAWFETTM